MEMFDKLFTYVDKSTDLTQSMINNYKNSMIVLGDQKQMFIPSINSYVGLGMDSYNYLLNKTKNSQIPKAVISRGLNISMTTGEIYGIEGNAEYGSRVPTKWYANLDNGITELTDGMIISIRMPTVGLETVGECLTIDGNESHFHQIVYNTNSFLTTHFPINTILTLQYDAYQVINIYGKYDSSTGKYVHNGNTQTSVTGVWRVLSTYYSNTDIRHQQTIYNLAKTVASNGCLVRYTLCMMTPNGKITSLFNPSSNTTDGNTLTNKTMYNDYLDPRKIFYWASSNYYAANVNVTEENVLLTHKSDLIDYRYTLNCGTTLTPYSSLYLVGTIDNNGFKLDPTTPWSCTLPTTEDGKVYIYVGMVYADTAGYRGTLEENNTIYIYKNGAVRLYTDYSEYSNYTKLAEYSNESSFSAYTQNSYTSYIIKKNNGLYPISFVSDNNINKYYSYSYITSTNNASVPPGLTSDDILNVHNIDLIRFKEFNSGLYWYENKNTLFATYFRGMLLGVASYTDSLYTARKINGTNFDGTENITTTYWGNGRNFYITDNSQTHNGPTVLVNGFSNVVLKLPTTLKADIIGNSTYSTTSDLSNRTYRQNVRLTNTNNSYYLTFTDGYGNNIFAYSYLNSKLNYNPHEEILYSSYFNGWLKGNADSTLKLIPLQSKDYNDNSFYATSADDHNLASRFFIKLFPEGTNNYWHIIYRVTTYVPNSQSYSTTAIVEYFGYGTTMYAYKIWNTIKSGYSQYYHAAMWTKQAGLDNGYGHLLGVNIINGTNYTTSTWYRYMHVDLLAFEGCNVELLDIASMYSTISGYNSTNYNDISNYNATSQGLQETGDETDTTTMQLYYTRFKAGSGGIMEYSLVMQDNNGTWQSFTTTSGIGSSKTKNTAGFKLGSRIYYMNLDSNIAANGECGNGVVRAYTSLIDLRYSLNIVANSLGNGLIYHKPVYIVGTIGYDDLFYLDNVWWTQEEPTYEDGKIYIRIIDSVYPDYNTTNMPSGNYRGDLISDGFAFWYKNGTFQKYIRHSDISYKTDTTKIILNDDNRNFFVTFSNNDQMYNYTYGNVSLLYNPYSKELVSTYFNATTLFRGHIKAQDQWGIL